MKTGEKSDQVRKLRENKIAARNVRSMVRNPKAFNVQTEAEASKPVQPPVKASAPTKEKTVKPKKTKAKTTRGPGARLASAKTPEQRLADGKKQLAAAKKARKAKAKYPHIEKNPVPVPALAVAKFMARPNGASMDELVAEFGIEAHPMRAKIHYIRHKLGWTVEIKDGRYHATEPKAA